MLLAGILAVLAQATAAPAPPAPPAAPGPPGPVVVITTNVGRIVVALDKQKAPIAVKNFILYVRGGHYDHTLFHRVVPRFMIQGGGYDEADMSEHPVRPPIKNESLNGLSNRRGTIAMARLEAPDSATAQFFINLRDNRQLDGRPGKPGYTVFGEVVEGMEVVDRIAAVRTTTRGRHRNVPVTPIVIQRVREAPGWKPKPEPTPEPATAPEAAPVTEPAPEAVP